MLIKNISDTQKIIGTAESQGQKQLLAKISFSIIDTINQQGNANIFSIFQKLSGCLNEDEQQNFYADLNFLLISYLTKQGNLDVFSIIRKLETLLTPENREQVTLKINNITENFLRQEDAPNTPVIEAFLFTQRQDSFSKTSLGKHNPVTLIEESEKLSGLRKPPAPEVKTEVNADKDISPLSRLMNSKAKPGSFQLRITPKQELKSMLSINDGLEYIIPVLTEKARKAINDFATSVDVYEFLKQIDVNLPLDNIFNTVKEKLFPDMTLVNFLDKIVEMEKESYLSYRKWQEFPVGKEGTVKMGDVLIFMELITPEQIEKALIIQRGGKISSQMREDLMHYDMQKLERAEHLKYKRSMLGDLLVDLMQVTHQQVHHALTFKKWYNKIIHTI